MELLRHAKLAKFYRCGRAVSGWLCWRDDRCVIQAVCKFWGGDVGFDAVSGVWFIRTDLVRL